MPRKPKTSARREQEPERPATPRIRGSARATMCEHRIPPENHCKRCDP